MTVKREDEARRVLCAGCGVAVNPGDQVVHVDDDDPWRTLWHRSCRDRLTPAPPR